MKHLILLLFVLTFASSGYTQDVSDVTQEGVTITEQGLQQTDEALSTILSKALEVATITGEFVIDQAPDLLRQFYLWHILDNLFFIFVGLLIVLTAILIFRSFGDRYEDDFWCDPAPFFTSVIGCLGIVLTLCCLHSLIFIWVAPKLYLIKYFIN
jgi:hypothetical protein